MVDFLIRRGGDIVFYTKSMGSIRYKPFNKDAKPGVSCSEILFSGYMAANERLFRPKREAIHSFRAKQANGLFLVFRPVRQAHVAFAGQGVVHGQCSRYTVRSLSFMSHLDIVPK